MKSTLSLAVLCLIGAIKAVNIQADVGLGNTADLSQLSESDAWLEANRYIGADGKPMILA
jgi:hypothetical protein